MAGVGLLMGVLADSPLAARCRPNWMDGSRIGCLPSAWDAGDDTQLFWHPHRCDPVHRLPLADLRFCCRAALFAAFLLSMLTGGALFAQLERLMLQVESGTFKAVDFDNFDEFF